MINQAPQREDATAIVERYVKAFNNGDEDGMAACFATPGHILDGMAPHVWFGASAPRDWWKDAAAEAEHLGISDILMTLGVPVHNEVTGEAGYFVAPATLTFKVRGERVTQTGAIFTAALRKVDSHWLIAAWAWTKGGGPAFGDVARAST